MTKAGKMNYTVKRIWIKYGVLQTLSQSGDGEMAYVRPDGTLWMSWQFQQNGNYVYPNFVQVGTETNWTAVALNWKRMVALKSDGSLWQWQFINPWNMSREQLILSQLKSRRRDWASTMTGSRL